MSSVLVSNCSSTCAIERIFSRSSLVRIGDRKSTRLNSSHSQISYAVFCLKKKKQLQHVGPSKARSLNGHHATLVGHMPHAAGGGETSRGGILRSLGLRPLLFIV